MSKPCITIDVSKGKSHVQGFYDYNKPLTKPFEIKHTSSDFSRIKKIYELLSSETKLQPLVIFEYTSIYHHTLVAYLEGNNFDYHIVSPLKSAKMRQKSIRSAKTDKRDCKNLADMFYMNELGAFTKLSKQDQALKELNRNYVNIKNHVQMYEVTLNEKLDIIYPNFETMFSDLLSDNTLKFLHKFPHPTILLTITFDELVEFFVTETKHSIKYSTKLANKLIMYCKDLVSGCTKNSPHVVSLTNTINCLNLSLSILKETEKQLIHQAKESQYYAIIRDMDGIGDNLAARFISEIGDISRFKKPEHLIAFMGIDPIVLQSGKMSGEHLRISKKGNKYLRTISFLIVRSMIKKKVKANPIKDYYYKKKAQPNVPPKVALVACINKLIRIIHTRCKTGEVEPSHQ